MFCCLYVNRGVAAEVYAREGFLKGRDACKINRMHSNGFLQGNLAFSKDLLCLEVCVSGWERISGLSPKSDGSTNPSRSLKCSL